jgi:hypothetical protein
MNDILRNRIILSALIKKAQFASGSVLERLQITGKFAFHLLGIASAKPVPLWVGCVLVGELGKEYDARARRICPQSVSGTKKEMTINCGWISVARAGRILNFAIQNHGRLVLHQSSRRDSPRRVV